jgi:hypothetical protein
MMGMIDAINNKSFGFMFKDIIPDCNVLADNEG